MASVSWQAPPTLDLIREDRIASDALRSSGQPGTSVCWRRSSWGELWLATDQSRADQHRIVDGRIMTLELRTVNRIDYQLQNPTGLYGRVRRRALPEAFTNQQA